MTTARIATAVPRGLRGRARFETYRARIEPEAQSRRNFEGVSRLVVPEPTPVTGIRAAKGPPD